MTSPADRNRVSGTASREPGATRRWRLALIDSPAAVIALAVVVVVGMLASVRGRASGWVLVVLAATQLLLIGAVMLLRRLSKRREVESETTTVDRPPADRAPEPASPVEAGVLTWMRHEIRTPINAIVGMADLLIESELTPTERDYLESLRASADALSATINDIHDLCRLETGRLLLDAQPFDLREAVELSFDQVAAKAAERNLDLAYLIDEETPPRLVGDVARLRQVLETLLANAVNRTRAGEVTVLVSARPVSADRHEVRFTVRDTGVSITEERRARLFQSLSQIVASGERPGDAHELGVALCRGLTHLMGGTIWLEVGASSGATFQFTIVADTLGEEPPAYLRSIQPQLANRRVLVVDDTTDNRALLARYITAWGALTRATDAPREALTWIREGETFDVAIIDARLPGDAAGMLAAEIGRSPGGPGTPALVMLHGPEPRSTARLKRSVALVQPVGPAQLLDVLTRVLERRPVEKNPLPLPAPLRILLAEDNPVSQKVALGVLRRLGHQVDVVADGRQVLEALERQPYDVVLMDMQMPEMDGVTVTRHLCERWPRDRRPGIIALSASEWPEDRARWLAAGADAWVSKTLPVEDLQSALARSASLRRRWDEDLAPEPGPDDVLGNLRRLESSGAPGLAAEVFDVFVQDTSGRLAALRDAVARRDSEAIERVAHSLKGSASMVGAASVAHSCAKLIGVARSGSLDRSEAIVAELEARVEAIQRINTSDLDARSRKSESRVFE